MQNLPVGVMFTGRGGKAGPGGEAGRGLGDPQTPECCAWQVVSRVVAKAPRAGRAERCWTGRRVGG